MANEGVSSGFMEEAVLDFKEWGEFDGWKRGIAVREACL